MSKQEFSSIVYLYFALLNESKFQPKLLNLHQNQHFDESLDIPDAEEVPSQYNTPTPRAAGLHGNRGDNCMPRRKAVLCHKCPIEN